MKKQLTIALVAHDHRKADMVDWAKSGSLWDDPNYTPMAQSYIRVDRNV